MLAIFSVAVILAIGISQFGKGDIESAKRSNRMMKLRIAAQFAAVLLLLLFIWLQ